MFFKDESFNEIYNTLHKSLQNNLSVSFKVINPDIFSSKYAGEVVVVDSNKFIYRGYKSWVSLAEILGCKILTPKSIGNFVEITLKKLESNSFHSSSDNDKYGVDSEFAKIDKMQEPSFAYYYIDALKRANIYNRESILNLGINRGDEFRVIDELIGSSEFKSKRCVGVDYSKSAIDMAKDTFKDSAEFYCADINELDSLNLGKFDCLISIGTLQSSSLNYKSLLMELVQNYLNRDSAIVLAFPNCRWIGGEMVYGARVPNYNFSEMGILYSDVIFAKKYLQQKKYRVTVTGKEYIFLTATRIRSALK